jgi:hypothetical protein
VARVAGAQGRGGEAGAEGVPGDEAIQAEVEVSGSGRLGETALAEPI